MRGERFKAVNDRPLSFARSEWIQNWLNGGKASDAGFASEASTAVLKDRNFNGNDWEKSALLVRGHIALEEHGLPVNYRNLKVRELK